MRRFLGIVAMVFASAVVASSARAADHPFPDTVDPAKRYVFYMHGAYVEKKGPNGEYDYYGILDALEAKGFVVVGEARGPTGFGQYAQKVAGQVRRLLDAGVPVGNILVAGHSKGGLIALLAATRLGDPNLHFGILAACGRKGAEFYPAYRKFVDKNAASLSGRFLVMWDHRDPVAGDCDAAMRKAPVDYENTVLKVGDGHKLFYRPRASWIDPLVAFAMGK